ncbi:MAG: histidine--tRNA ligase [Candidatus Veblenbacteria bacterium]|nr:histidine--tRNA ligase [Candidatus Veblenbacteria bacterium]MDZ4230072.1 histidine--tRNA ligase [Candidatus Veblenbacteria bacterium]
MITPATEKNKPTTPEEPLVKVKKVVPPQLVRGMHDILPVEWPWWSFVMSEVGDLAQIYSFERIETPALEKTNLFTRAIGAATDVVEKEMYSFVDQSGDHLSLRPEYTAGLARAYIEHGMHTWPQPVKLYALGSLFRHERPQAGRYREFWQFDFEILGEASPTADCQLIVVAAALFESLHLPVTVQINSVGCPNCRPAYRTVLQDYYRTKRSVLCEDCKRRLQRNPLRLLDCKEEADQALARQAPQLVDFLCEPCHTHFVRLLEYLDEVELAYQLNPYLVRGLDYYTRTVFEVWGPEEGKSALAAGGRYDNLIAELGGVPTPAVGFAGGVERVVSELKARQVGIPLPPPPDLFLACLGETARKKAIRLFEDLRRQGIRVAESFTKDGLKSQLEIANRLKVKFTLVMGQKELTDGTIIVRDMENGIQEIVDQQKVVEEVQKRLATHQPDTLA